MASQIRPTPRINIVAVRGRCITSGKVQRSREGTFVAGEDLVLLSICGRLASEPTTFFINNYNTAGRELKVAKEKVVRFTEEDVEHVYGLYLGGSKVSLYIEDNDIDDLQIWASDLKLPCSSKGNMKISLMESRLAAEEDDEKWFMIFVMLLIGSLFKP
ncbi:hypothetical protein LINGRAHAP2_LOCUS22860 [Linum grandiflorum]